MPTLGFIGFGEAAYYMSLGLGEEGVNGIKAYDPAVGGKNASLAELIRQRAGDAGVSLTGSVAELVNVSEVILCAVPAQYNEAAALSVLPFMTAGTLYVDVTSCSPLIKEKLANIFADKGFRYVDSAMLGALPNDRHKTPLCCSGKGAGDWVAIATAWNMKPTLMEGPAGLGSKVKLTRSTFMKGLQALCDESFLLARKLGLEENLIASLSGTFAKESVEKMFPRFMCADAVHAERRMHEAAESVALMEAVGVVPAVAKGVVERMRLTAAMGLRGKLGGKPPKDIQTLYALWESEKYQ